VGASGQIKKNYIFWEEPTYSWTDFHTRYLKWRALMHEQGMYSVTN